MYGPVNIYSYYFMRPKFYSVEDESNDNILVNFAKEIKKSEKFIVYEPIIKKLKEIDSQKLVYFSHHNIEYKNARKSLKEFEPCDKELDEEKEDFITFDAEVKEEVNDIFSNIE